MFVTLRNATARTTERIESKFDTQVLHSLDYHI